MEEIDSLMARIDAELKAKDERIKKLQSEGLQAFKGREQRLVQFGKVLDELRGILRPRLEAFAKRFGDRVHVTPTVDAARREALFAFGSDLAQIQLRFSALTDQEVTRVIFNYDLKIMPILMQFESHAELEFPLDRVDRDALTKWIEDRLVAFVRTYLSLHENEYYLKGHMVEDPVAHVKFPREAAGATLEVGGETHYFLGEETRREFERKLAVSR